MLKTTLADFIGPIGKKLIDIQADAVQDFPTSVIGTPWNVRLAWVLAGASSLSLGFEQAGFDVVAAVEVDPVHCAVHKFNFPNCAVLPYSVAELSGYEIRLAAGIGLRPVEVVFGGAPCQGFSLIGHRVLDDPRNALVKEFVRLVRGIEGQLLRI